MPYGDRKGPEGLGPRTGRRMGLCSGYNTAGYTKTNRTGGGRRLGRRGTGRGLGAGRGFGRGYGYRHTHWLGETNFEPKDLLEDEIKQMEEELKIAREELKRLKGEE